MGIIKIGNQSFVGNNIKINNGKVKIDGKPISLDENQKIFNIEITGNIDSINSDADGDINVNGNVGKIETITGSVKCKNVTGSVTSDTGNINCEKVGGDVGTDTGDIHCGDVGGNAKSSTGNISAKNIKGDARTNTGDINKG